MWNVPTPFMNPLNEVDTSHPAFMPIEERFFTSFAWYDLLSKTAIHGEAILLDNRQSGPKFSGMVLHKVRQRRLGLSFTSIEAFSNYYSMYYNVIGSAQPDDLFALGACLGSLDSPLARFGPFPAEDGSSRRLGMALSANGFSVRTSEAFGNWIEPTNGRSFEAYFASRPSQIINTYDRKRRALEKLHSWRFRMMTSADEELEEIILEYLGVYDQSWKPKENSPEFMPNLIRLAAKHGLLRLGLLEVNDEVAAVQIWIIDGRSSIIYKLAHSPKYEKFSVGLILTVEMMRHAFDIDRVDLIDFGSGDDPYKAHWMSQRRSRETLTAYNRRTSLGQLASLKT
jgi:uncharacterized protein YjiS (DUF1127 family)